MRLYNIAHEDNEQVSKLHLSLKFLNVKGRLDMVRIPAMINFCCFSVNWWYIVTQSFDRLRREK